MMRLIAAVLLVSIGCSDDPPDLPPTLEVTSPARGTLADAETVTVTGIVKDDGPVKLTVGGQDVTPAKDGSFTATVLVIPGISLIETHAIDGGGHDVRDVRAVLAGKLGPTDGTQPALLGARAGVAALAKIGGAIATTAKAVDYTAAAKALNPIYDNGGCLGATINITSITLTNVGVALVPKTNALATDVTIENLVVKLSASFKVACLGGSTTITMRASKAKIHGDLTARVASEKIATSLPTATVGFEGFSIDVGGVPGAIESLLKDEARAGVSRVLASMIRSKVPPMADKTLAGLVAKPLSASILDAATTITVVPKQVTIAADGLFVGVETKLKVTGGEDGTFVTTPTSLSLAAMNQAHGLGIALDDDAINQLFAGLWSADKLEASVSLDAIPALGALLDDDARTIDITQSLPPTVSTAGGELELAIGDMIVTVRDEAGAEVHRIAVSVRTTLSTEPSQTGKVLLTVGAPEVFAQVLAESEAVEVPLEDSQVEAIVTGAWGLIGVKADDILSKLPMPTIVGVMLGAPTVSAADAFVLADIALQ